MKKLLKCYYHVKIIEEEGKGDELDANLYKIRIPLIKLNIS